MILATGSVTLYRSGRHAHHSFGYYLAAMKYFDADFMANGVQAIQDLLLICRFGIYHHTGAFSVASTAICASFCDTLTDSISPSQEFQSGMWSSSVSACVLSRVFISHPNDGYLCWRNSCIAGYSGNVI